MPPRPSVERETDGLGWGAVISSRASVAGRLGQLVLDRPERGLGP